MSACPPYGTVTKTTSAWAAAFSFDVPPMLPRLPEPEPRPRMSRTLSAAAAPRSSERDPITTCSPAWVSRSARPNPSSPVPPMMAMVMPSSSATDVVELLVHHRPGHRSAFILEGLPEPVGPFLDGRPHPPEVLLRGLSERPVRVDGRDLVRRVVEDEDGRPESVFDLLVHSMAPLTLP